jgi:hypothetical protein
VNASRLLPRFLLPATLAVALTGCGGSGSGQSGSAFVFLTVQLFTPSGSTGISQVNSGLDDTRSTIACATLTNNLKNPTVTGPTSLDNVTITSYTVSLSRSDGGGTPGPFTFNAAFTVPAGRATSSTDPTISGNSVTVAVIVVPSEAKSELGGARRPLAGSSVLVFKGRDGRGQKVEAEGGISVTFISGDDPAVSCPAPS